MTDSATGPARAHDRVVSLNPGVVKRYLEVVKDLAGVTAPSASGERGR
jgi:hypothetical protein